jgi:hypothetical protein
MPEPADAASHGVSGTGVVELPGVAGLSLKMVERICRYADKRRPSDRPR